MVVWLFGWAVAVADEAPVIEELTRVVPEAFRSVHDGWSCDEVLLQDALRERFVSKCRESVPEASEKTCLWRLLTLRKAGKLHGHTTRHGARVSADLRPAAEYAARHMEDRFQTNMDRVLCDPKLRVEFDRVATQMLPHQSVYQLRKAAFTLRKTRQLQPELLLRIADWDRRVLTFSGADLLESATESGDVPAADDVHTEGSTKPSIQEVSKVPGVYIFSNPSGYLYIGESKDLLSRLREHASDEPTSLRHLLRSEGIAWDDVTIEIHAFAADSRMKQVRTRRAYESELIASRSPRFNVRP